MRHNPRSVWTLGAALLVVIATLVLAPGAWAAKFKTLYTFTPFGNDPSGLIFDAAGNLYGTTQGGGAYGNGTVFEITPSQDGNWSESVLYSFTGGADGRLPYASLLFDQAGNLYGTTYAGGANANGTVFEVSPNGDGTWTESVLHDFYGEGWDGWGPYAGLIFDPSGNLYGTTLGGANGAGVVFKLAPNGDGSWMESILCDSAIPYAGLILDPAGNLYGTTAWGGIFNGGTVFELTPGLDGAWIETVLYSFNSGAHPVAGLSFDAAWNFYGTNSGGGTYESGVIFKGTRNPDGSWAGSVLHQFTGGVGGASPSGSVTFDKAGNMYGTTVVGGADDLGIVFEGTPNPDGSWKGKFLHQFTGGDGGHPSSGVILDQAGNLYGTTLSGGYGFSSVFEITP